MADLAGHLIQPQPATDYTVMHLTSLS